MSESTVRRERLVNPISLILIGVVFAIAFTLLLPNAQTFVLNRQAQTEDAAKGTPQVDDLDLAYLKARSAQGKLQDEEIRVALDSLLENRQFDKLDELLSENPSIQLSDQQNFRRELEAAVSEFQEAGGVAGDNRTTLQLANTLAIIQTEPGLQTESVVKRALQLSKPLGRHEMTRDFYDLLITGTTREISDDEKARYYSDCGEHFASVAMHQESADCFRRALLIPQDPAQTFDINVALLAQVEAMGNPVALEEVVTQIVMDQSASEEQLQRATRALLAVGRPDAAHPLFARLARKDPARRSLWFSEAAKWAKASSDVEAAIAYTESMITADPGLKTRAVEAQLQEYWIAAGQNEKALKHIYESLERNPSDVTTLRQGVSLARQLNFMGQAKIWNEQLLEIDRNDVEAIELQVVLALGTRDIEGAFEWANIAVVMEPQNVEARRTLAQIAEWSGRPEEAEEHWLWVTRNQPDADGIAHVVRLAEMNFRHDSAAEASLKLALIKKPTNDEINKLIEFYELNGEPSKAATAVRRVIKKHGRSAFMLSRLGQLHQRHAQFTEALIAWEELEKHYGRTTESLLALTELNWRLENSEKAASIAANLESVQQLKEASDYQIRLLSELSWRYREPELGRMLEPVLEQLEDSGQREFYQGRILKEFTNEGNYDQAFEMVNAEWQTGGKVSAGLQAMELAEKTSDPASFELFLAPTPVNKSLQREPRYWTMAAMRHLREGETDKATDAYREALRLDSSNTAAIGGMLWLFIGEGKTDELEQALARYENKAENEAELWAPYGVGHLQLGNAAESVGWFERQLDTIDGDYSLLLTFSDALEAAGKAEEAYRVRRFAIGKLRPLIGAATEKDRLKLTRQYASLVTRFGAAEQGEQWTRYLVGADDGSAKPNPGEGDKYWREDVALAWFMATQRHEHARLVMARIHEERVKKPVWQALAMAMNDRDFDVLDTMLASADNISVANRILALGVLGRERDAIALARQTGRTGPTASDRAMARQQYIYLRGIRPSYSGVETRSTDSGVLNLNETKIALRHSFSGRAMGIGVDITKSNYSSDEYNLNGQESRDNIALSVYFGNSQSGGRLTSGLVVADNADVAYATGRYFSRADTGDRQWAAEFGFNEPATQSPALRIAALQNRLGVEYESSFGSREYYRLSADVSELFTRVQEESIARGFQARGELGMRGVMGSNTWSSSVSVSTSRFNHADSTPAELLLTPGSSIGSAIASETSSIALGGSIARGGVSSDYPQTSSPRYFLNGIVGHAWPDQSFGLQLEGGVGMRVLGGDELSFSFAHDGLANSLVKGDGNTTSLGLNYRYHFKR